MQDYGATQGQSTANLKEINIEEMLQSPGAKKYIYFLVVSSPVVEKTYFETNSVHVTTPLLLLILKLAILLEVTLCSLVDRYQRIGDT